MKKYIKIFFIILILFFTLKNKAFAEETLILFDSSVSMLENLNGTPKYIQSVRAAKKVLQNVDDERKIGLRIIGILPDENIFQYLLSPEKLCQATQLLNPIESNNIENISLSLDSLLPIGTTPLTYSLSVAISNDFTNTNELKHIILITDGAESCNENPCNYIKQLMKSRNDIKIDVISFTNKKDELFQLKCLTSSTNGKIIPVNSESTFTSAFTNIINAPLIIQNNNKKIEYKNYFFEFNK